MSVTKGSDELWVGVKYQSNLEIAGSPRNVFRYSRANSDTGGRALLECGGREPYQALANYEYRCHRARVRRWVRTFIVKRATTQTRR